MRIKDIYSRDADFQKFQVLKTNRNKRHRYGEFFVEGVRNLNQAAENGWSFSAFLSARGKELSGWARDMLARVEAPTHYRLSPELLEELSSKEDCSELMAVVKMRSNNLALLPLPENPLLVLFDRPSNRGNLGTLLRSCDGLGADGLILTGHGVDLYDPEVVTASMGSFFRVPAVQVENHQVAGFLAQCRERYAVFKTVGTTAHRQHPIYSQDLTGPLLLMLGNETDGLSYAYKQSCDVLCTIPMAEDSSASSFNVACAGTVLLYEAARQRASAPVDLGASPQTPPGA